MSLPIPFIETHIYTRLKLYMEESNIYFSKRIHQLLYGIDDVHQVSINL